MKDIPQPENDLLGLNPDVLNVRNLRDHGFYLPGKEGVIPLGISPWEMTPRKYQEFCEDAQTLTMVNTKALAYALTSPKDLRTILVPPTNPDLRTHVEQVLHNHSSYDQMARYLLRQPTLQRPDFLITPSGSSHELKLLEFNCTRPGGIYLENLAASILHRAGSNTVKFVPPNIEGLWNFFTRAARPKHRGTLTVALCYSHDYVAEIEMPRLTQLLNAHSREQGADVLFESMERDELRQTASVITDTKGTGYDVVYENAAPQADGHNFRFYASDQDSATVVVNSPITSLGDNKALLATYFDPTFRNLLSPAELEAIDKTVPPTQLVRTPEEMLAFTLINGLRNSVIKATEGILASSGKGVYIGPNITGEQLTQILDNLGHGTTHIAMDKIPPEEPWLRIHRLGENGTVTTTTNFSDLAPYIVNPGTGLFSVNGTLSRARPEHPINVTQGGTLVVVGVKQ